MDTNNLNLNHENREFLINALSAALRWYAHTTDRQKGDEQSAVVLIDFMQDLRAS